MKKKLYLMRHGKTQMNEQNLNQGFWDSPLTQEGIEGAVLAGKALKALGITFDAAYASTSERACDALELVTENKLPYKRLKGLKEINMGLFEGQPCFLNPPYPFGDYFKNYQGESTKEVVERLEKTLIEILSDEKAQSVLAVSHGGACGNLMFKWLPASTLKEYSGTIPNGTIFVYEYETDNQSFDLVEVIEPDRQREIVEQSQEKES